jgi:hypothetical protein
VPGVPAPPGPRDEANAEVTSVARATVPAGWIEIALPNGRVVRAQPGFDPETLARALSSASGVVSC